MSNHCWMVSELYHPEDTTLPRYVYAHRQGQAPWRAVWEHKDELPGRLAAWFRTLSDAKTEPLARPLLGHRCALSEAAALAVCRLRIAQIRRMAGCGPGEWPDFLAHEKPVNCGRRGRPCAIVTADGVRTYRSIADAARAEGVTREAIAQRIGEARQDGGRVAV